MRLIQEIDDPISGLSHLVSAVMAAAGGGVLLYLSRGDGTRQITLLAYSIGLFLMFASSAAYHLVQKSSPISEWLRKFDHCAIYLLIAATYTPICVRFFSGFYREGLLAIIWGLALVGIGVKMFIIQTPRWLTVLLYLVMGWLAILGMQEILLRMPGGAVFWLILGGVFFTVGSVVYATQKPDPYPGVFGFHELWHIFVTLGAGSHYLLMVFFVAPVI
ncbi:MAG: hemolysin III family protein [Anaerolineales bacterium]|nr:hemolysin III family protein [Anaerolineales bacterium]